MFQLGIMFKVSPSSLLAIWVSILVVGTGVLNSSKLMAQSKGLAKKPTPVEKSLRWQKPSPKQEKPPVLKPHSTRLPEAADRGAPEGTEGAAVQGPCPASAGHSPPLTALVPTFRSAAAEVAEPFGATTLGHPTFWFYVPYSEKSQRIAEFVLINEAEDDVYATEIKLTNVPGVISIPLPKTITELQVGNEYRWVFSTMCDPSNRSGDISVNGWIQRVKLGDVATSQLQQAASADEKVEIYFENGLWYDALTTLAELRRQKPKDDKINAYWDLLLKSIKLENLTPINISSCCQLQEAYRHSP
jgi:Domain of Unknown Function (DUF928)